MTQAKKVVIAVPSVSPGGLHAQRSGHFGQCDCFTLVELEGGRVAAERVLVNPPHTEGGCLAPVKLLADAGATAIVVGGIGMRPLMGFRQSGLEVLMGVGTTVNEAVQAMLRGDLSPVGDNQACGGH